MDLKSLILIGILFVTLIGTLIEDGLKLRAKKREICRVQSEAGELRIAIRKVFNRIAPMLIDRIIKHTLNNEINIYGRRIIASPDTIRLASPSSVYFTGPNLLNMENEKIYPESRYHEKDMDGDRVWILSQLSTILGEAESRAQASHAELSLWEKLYDMGYTE
jgi:hypothetical protein